MTRITLNISATVSKNLANPRLISSSESSFVESVSQQQLTEALKTSRPDGQYRLKCQLSCNNNGGLAGHDGLGVMGLNLQGAGSGQTDTGRQLASILKKVRRI